MAQDRKLELQNRKHRLKPFMVGNNKLEDRAAHETSAAIHIDDLDGGFLTARLTTEQRDGIDDPATGLLIYNLSNNGFEYFDGTMWTAFGSGTGHGISDISIPTPYTGINRSPSFTSIDIFVHFAQSIEHLSELNPRIILMRYKQGRRSHVGISPRGNKRWVHPSHQNGVNAVGKMNGGAHSDSNGNALPPRDTEWIPTSLGANERTVVNMNLSLWFNQVITVDGNNPWMMTGDTNTLAHGDVFGRSQMFAFCLEIDNPDEVARNTIPRVRGDISTPFATKVRRDTHIHTGDTIIDVAYSHIPIARTFV